MLPLVIGIDIPQSRDFFASCVVLIFSATPTILIMCVLTNTTSPAVSVKHSPNTKKANKRIKRSLTFAPEISKVIGTVISREDYTVEENESCRWSNSELSMSRTHSVQRSIAIRERGQHFTNMIDESFMMAQCLSTALGDKEVDSLLQDPSNYTSKLEAWSLLRQSDRGLEQHISVFQETESIARIREIRGMVLANQRMGVSSEEAAEMYAAQSLASRIYSRWVGDADYSSSQYLQGKPPSMGCESQILLLQREMAGMSS
jgi:hypothetical protein